MRLFYRGNILPTILLLVVFFMPLWPSYYVIKKGAMPGFDLTRILILILIVIWTLSFVTCSRLRSRVKHEIQLNKKIFIILAIFFIWKLVSVISSQNYLHATFSAFKDIVYYFFLFLIAITVWKEKEQLITVIKVMVIASIVIACITLIEFIFQHNFLVSLAPQAFEKLQSTVDVTMRDGFYRTNGTFANSLALASYVVTMLPLSAWLYTESRGRWRLISLVSLIGLFICVYTTGSRTALATVSLLLAGSIFFKLLGWKRKSKGKTQSFIIVMMLFVSILGGVAVTSIGLMLAEGRSEKESGSSNIRLKQIKWGVPLILSRPFLGYGPGEAGDTLKISTGTVDNYFLTLGLESGVFVVVLFATILFYFISLCWNMQRQLIPPWSNFSMALFLVVSCDTLFLAVISLEQTIPLMFLMFAMATVLKSDSSRVLRKI